MKRFLPLLLCSSFFIPLISFGVTVSSTPVYDSQNARYCGGTYNCNETWATIRAGVADNLDNGSAWHTLSVVCNGADNTDEFMRVMEVYNLPYLQSTTSTIVTISSIDWYFRLNSANANNNHSLDISVDGIVDPSANPALAWTDLGNHASTTFGTRIRADLVLDAYNTMSFARTNTTIILIYRTLIRRKKFY